jgi:hypothetical protein
MPKELLLVLAGSGTWNIRPNGFPITDPIEDPIFRIRFLNFSRQRARAYGDNEMGVLHCMINVLERSSGTE